MKQVMSISLGSSERDKVVTEKFGEELIRIERKGTNGDKKLAKQLLVAYDGKVDAIGLGGTDLYVYAGGQRYTFRESQELVGAVKKTPVLDGSGLKNSLERVVIANLEKKRIINFLDKKVLLVCGVDRFGMGEALVAAGAKVTFGDIIFGLGLDVPIYSLKALARFAKVLAPIITKLPVSWFYPMGDEQKKRVSRYPEYFRKNDIIAGDFLFIRKYMPDDMVGKTIITNTVTASDREFLQRAGVSCLITTTPNLNGRSFGTNVLESVLVALAGQGKALTANEYEQLLKDFNVQPGIEFLSKKE